VLLAVCRPKPVAKEILAGFVRSVILLRCFGLQRDKLMFNLDAANGPEQPVK